MVWWLLTCACHTHTRTQRREHDTRETALVREVTALRAENERLSARLADATAALAASGPAGSEADGSGVSASDAAPIDEYHRYYITPSFPPCHCTV